MNVIALTKYSHGYTGFLELEDRYVFFQCAGERHKFLQQYLKSDYENHDHFIEFIRKFVHATFFLNRPVRIRELTKEELDRVYAESQST